MLTYMLADKALSVHTLTLSSLLFACTMDVPFTLAFKSAGRLRPHRHNVTSSRTQHGCCGPRGVAARFRGVEFRVLGFKLKVQEALRV